MEGFIEFFGDEDALTMIAALSFIVIMFVLFIYDKIRTAVNKKRREKSDKELKHKERIEKRRVLEQKAFDFAMVYCSLGTDSNDENTVVYREVFI